MKQTHQKGFTIVELLIVIVVIGILAAIVIVSFNGIQERSRTTKINSDISTLAKAIEVARVNSDSQATIFITGSTGTAASCVSTADGVDLSDKTAAATCWSSYNNALNAISNASGMNVRGLMDPWGRPYYLDENEKEGSSTCGINRDSIGSFPNPRTSGSWTVENVRQIPYITPGC